jgi:hypothetical protein
LVENENFIIRFMANLKVDEMTPSIILDP